MKRSGIIALLAGAAIILGLGLLVFKNQDRTNYPPATQGNSLQIKDQAAGNVVTVDSATLDLPGFAVIHEANGARLGRAVGVSPLLATGENSLVFIAAQTAKGKEYFVALYADDGDGTFDQGLDSVFEDTRGQELKIKFKAL